MYLPAALAARVSKPFDRLINGPDVRSEIRIRHPRRRGRGDLRGASAAGHQATTIRRPRPKLDADAVADAKANAEAAKQLPSPEATTHPAPGAASSSTSAPPPAPAPPEG